MSDIDDSLKIERELIGSFLIEFGDDWVESEKVREFIFNDQIKRVRLHEFLENKIDAQKPLDGITHRRLKPDALVRFKRDW